MDSVHTAADAHAFTTECSIVKIHKRLHRTGYHLSPYIHFTEEKKNSKRNAFLNILQSISASVSKQ